MRSALLLPGRENILSGTTKEVRQLSPTFGNERYLQAAANLFDMTLQQANINNLRQDFQLVSADGKDATEPKERFIEGRNKLLRGVFIQQPNIFFPNFEPIPEFEFVIGGLFEVDCCVEGININGRFIGTIVNMDYPAIRESVDDENFRLNNFTRQTMANQMHYAIVNCYHAFENYRRPEELIGQNELKDRINWLYYGSDPLQTFASRLSTIISRSSD